MDSHIEKPIAMRDTGLTGTPDMVRLYPERKSILVLDFKFGFTTVERAEVNIQTRAYAVMSVDSYPGEWETVFVSIVQPRALYDERVTIARYTREDIEAARKQILEILKSTKDPNAPLVAGEAQCRYCKAKLICPAFREQMMLPAVITPDTNLSKTAREAYLEKKLAECSNEELEKVMNAVKLAGLIKEPANDEARKRISDGTMPGYSLGKETGVRSIADVKRAIGLLRLNGVLQDHFYECISGMAIGKIEELLREHVPGIATAKDAKEWVNTKLSKVIEIENRKPKIIKEKAP